MWIQQANLQIHTNLPVEHWLSPVSKVNLTSANASDFGYYPYTARTFLQYETALIALLGEDTYARHLLDSGIWLQHVNRQYELAVANMVKDTPAYEREGWHKQEAEASAWTLDAETTTPYVDNLALMRGVDRAMLLNKILEKIALYEVAHAQLTGLRQAKEDALKALALEASPSLEDVQAIVFEVPA